MKRFTFHNSGSITTFSPSKTVEGGTALEFYKDLVRTADRRDVYIMDHKGREVDCDGIVTPLKRAA